MVARKKPIWIRVLRKRCLISANAFSFDLKDKSGVVIIFDYSRDSIVVNDVKYFFQFYSL